MTLSQGGCEGLEQIKEVEVEDLPATVSPLLVHEATACRGRIPQPWAVTAYKQSPSIAFNMPDSISAITSNQARHLSMPFETSLSEVSATAQVAFAVEQLCEASLNVLLTTGSAILDSILAMLRTPSSGGPPSGNIC
jgi:hypothetical protein